jgi:hypothetical protein
MQRLEVGGYLKGRPQPVQEGCTMSYDASGPVLLISLAGLTKVEASKLQRGEMELAVFEKDEILFLLVNIPGVLDWSDAPFHMGLYPDGRQLPAEEIPDGGGWGLTIIGVEAKSGMVKSLRLIGLGTEISREMFRIIRAQGKTTQVEQHNRIAKTYREYDCEKMVQKATARHKVGGTV